MPDIGKVVQKLGNGNRLRRGTNILKPTIAVPESAHQTFPRAPSPIRVNALAVVQSINDDLRRRLQRNDLDQPRLLGFLDSISRHIPDRVANSESLFYLTTSAKCSTKESVPGSFGVVPNFKAASQKCPQAIQSHTPTSPVQLVHLQAEP